MLSGKSKSGMRSPLPRIAILVLLLLLIVIGAVPGYLKGQWSWAQPVPVENLNAIKRINKTGLSLPKWNTVEQTEVRLGGHKWSVQLLSQTQDKDEKPISLLLRPQNDSESQPEVEWMDIAGINKWKTDSYSTLKLTAPVPVETTFFRAWNARQTYAVVQWYGWPTGGSPKPFDWFLADRWAQLRKERLPWVAVSLHLPIEPLGDITSVRPLAESLAKLVQTSLIEDVFSPDSKS